MEHMQHRFQHALDKELGQEHTVFPKRAVKILKLPKGVWNTKRLIAVDEFGNYMYPKRVSQLSFIQTIEVIDRIESVINFLKDEMDGKNLKDGKPISQEGKMMAAKLTLEAAKVHANLTAHLLKLSDKCHEKRQTNKPKNLPPMLNVNIDSRQVTVQPPAATSGTLPEQTVPHNGH